VVFLLSCPKYDNPPGKQPDLQLQTRSRMKRWMLALKMTKVATIDLVLIFNIDYTKQESSANDKEEQEEGLC
jgi:hypothetical protein